MFIECGRDGRLAALPAFLSVGLLNLGDLRCRLIACPRLRLGLCFGRREGTFCTPAFADPYTGCCRGYACAQAPFGGGAGNAVDREFTVAERGWL